MQKLAVFLVILFAFTVMLPVVNSNPLPSCVKNIMVPLSPYNRPISPGKTGLPTTNNADFLKKQPHIPSSPHINSKCSTNQQQSYEIFRLVNNRIEIVSRISSVIECRVSSDFEIKT